MEVGRAQGREWRRAGVTRSLLRPYLAYCPKLMGPGFSAAPVPSTAPVKLSAAPVATACGSPTRGSGPPCARAGGIGISSDGIRSSGGCKPTRDTLNRCAEGKREVKGNKAAQQPQLTSTRSRR